jgi:Tfp pilus assembly protein PilV
MYSKEVDKRGFHMDWNILILFVVIAAGAGGFAVLARTLLQNWRAQSRGKEAVDAYHTRQSMEYEKRFNECMAKANWDPDKREVCEAISRNPT